MLQRLAAAVASLAPATRAELSQVLALLAAAPGRWRWAAWPTTGPQAKSTADIARALQSMRTSPLAVRQQVYHALRDLTNAAWYVDAERPGRRSATRARWRV